MQPNQQFTVTLSRQFPPSSYVYSTLHFLQVQLSAVYELMIELPELYTVFVYGTLCNGTCVDCQRICVIGALGAVNVNVLKNAVSHINAKLFNP
jgi:hypothetical protein